MSFCHTNLSLNKWFSLPLKNQMANIGTEIFRTINYRTTNDNYSKNSFDRAIDLLDLTIQDPKNKKQLKELLRAREVLADYFCFNNIYNSNDKIWNDYFYQFAFSIRK